MAKCWMLNADNEYVRYFCAEDAFFMPVPQFGAGRVGITYSINGQIRSLFVDVIGAESWVTASLSTLVSGTAKPTNPGLTEYGSCDGCLSSNYDCINGTCTESGLYKTPGLYKSLIDCQAVCANGGACGSGKQCVDPTSFCPDGKVCIEQAEYTNIQALIAQINSEVC